MSTDPNQLPMAARALFVVAGIDLERFDTEVQFAEIENAYDKEEAA